MSWCKFRKANCVQGFIVLKVFVLIYYTYKASSVITCIILFIHE